jgi:hypothetical protein|tara:strand:- start:122 stop:469 length:348 start_codon:yes stop_codon:yes gene_type:complete
MNANVKPRFEVHKLNGKAKRRIATPKADKDGKLLGGFEYEDIDHDAGWMVYFPNGSSIRVWTEEEMNRQGFLSDPHLVNMETGDDMGVQQSVSLRSRSEQKERVTKSSKVHHVTQ